MSKLFICRLLINRRRILYASCRAANRAGIRDCLLTQHDEFIILQSLEVPLLLQEFAERFFVGFSRLPPKEINVIVRQTAVLLLAGISTEEALRSLCDDFHASHDRRAELLMGEILTDLHQGMLLSECLASRPKVFPRMLCSLAYVGDQTGLMGECLLHAADNLEAIQKLKGDVKRALIYPIFTFGTMIAAGAFWLYYVIPNMAQLFKQMNAKLPAITERTIEISNLLVNNVDVIAGVLVFAAVCLSICWANSQRMRFLILGLVGRLPIFGRMSSLASQCVIFENMKVLYTCGVDFVKAIEITGDSIRNELHRNQFSSVLADLRHGATIVQSLTKTGLFRRSTLIIVSAGEKSGSLDRQFAYLANHFTHELKTLIDGFSEALKPLIVIVAGGFFIFLIVALLLPIYDLVRQTMSSLGGS